MTLLDVRNQIVQHFCRKDIFTPGDFAAIRLAPAFEERREAVVRAALHELVDNGFLRPGVTAAVADDFWLMSLPMGFAGQNVHVSLQVAGGVAACINTYFEARGVTENQVDALNLNEQHFVTLLEILGDVLSTDPDKPSG